MKNGVINYFLNKKWFISIIENSDWYKSKHDVKICDKCNEGIIRHHQSMYGHGFTYDICDNCYSTWNENGEYLGIPTKKVLGLSSDNSIMFDYREDG